MHVEALLSANLCVVTL